MLKTPFYNYEYWDLQFYYKMHVVIQKSHWEIPLAYDTFIKRLKKMTLYDAINRPRSREKKWWKSKTPIQDYQRRIAKLKEENIQFLAFEEMKKVELKQRKAKLERLQRKLNNTPRYNMKPNRLKNLRFRFISFFKG